MDGFELSELIRDFYRTHKVSQPMIVACTGHVQEDFIKKAWTHEMDEVMPKPVNIEILKDIFKEVICEDATYLRNGENSSSDEINEE